jgi:hypothetical protein
MPFKKIESIGSVNPEDHLYVPIWVVFGLTAHHALLRLMCINQGYSGITIWGYSHYANKAAYRTDGVELQSWIQQNTHDKFTPSFFIDQDCALNYLKAITTPRCDPIKNIRQY